ncbi:MAG: hypothetical protein FWE35_09365 [Streptosporangiales bacterium]|jgi:hypothetical protein|nr:hypothetical protein [Streptosporangiales bacterium]
MTTPRVPEEPDERQLVAVPAHPGAGPGELVLEARREPRGVVLPVFSSVRVLVNALGRSQPWAVMPLSRAGDLASAAGVDQIMFDPEISAGAWQWEPFEAAGLTWRR